MFKQTASVDPSAGDEDEDTDDGEDTDDDDDILC